MIESDRYFWLVLLEQSPKSVMSSSPHYTTFKTAIALNTNLKKECDRW
ncbi:hypothetical protein [Nostoc sp. LEGE 12450]|nr:hypothetical protein [Nostoc sp. LEGE 12450]MBE8991380.1 hypothetical protein [Nostoc sp. LEGE 12450]